MYRDNTEWCERVFAGIWRRLSVQEYMLAGKARDEFRLLEKGTDDPTCIYTRGDCVDKRVVFTVEGLRKTSLLRDSLRED